MCSQKLQDPNYDEEVDVEKKRTFFYFGDELGMIKVWDITYLLSHHLPTVKQCKKTH